MALERAARSGGAHFRYGAHVAKIKIRDGRAIGVDMTPAMIERARDSARAAGLDNVEILQGDAQALPLDDASIDVVISNGVLNLVADKRLAFTEIRRVLRPGGTLQFADIANGNEVPEEAIRDIDLWTA